MCEAQLTTFIVIMHYVWKRRDIYVNIIRLMYTYDDDDDIGK